MPMPPVKRTSLGKTRIKKKSAEQQWAKCGTQMVKADHIARALDVTTARKRAFWCLTCPQTHAMSLVLTTDKRYKHAGHFRHPQVRGGGGSVHTHTGAGESDEHQLAKALLQSRVGGYRFLVSQCTGCADHDCWEDGANAHVELERSVSVGGNRYIYDAVLKRGGESVVMEVWHTHETGACKISDTHSAGFKFAEFCTADVLRLQHINPPAASLSDRWVFLENLKIRTFSCAPCLVREQERVKGCEQRKEIEREREREEYRDRARWRERQRVYQLERKKQIEVARLNDIERDRVYQLEREKQIEIARLNDIERERERERELERLKERETKRLKDIEKELQVNIQIHTDKLILRERERCVEETRDKATDLENERIYKAQTALLMGNNNPGLWMQVFGAAKNEYMCMWRKRQQEKAYMKERAKLRCQARAQDRVDRELWPRVL